MAVHPCFVELPLLAFISSFLLGLLCCSPQQCYVYGVRCFGIQSGGKPFFGEKDTECSEVWTVITPISGQFIYNSFLLLSC